MRGHYTEVDNLTSSTGKEKKCADPIGREPFKSQAPNVPLSHKSVITLCGTRIDACMSILTFLKHDVSLKSEETKSVENAQELYLNGVHLAYM